MANKSELMQFEDAMMLLRLGIVVRCEAWNNPNAWVKLDPDTRRIVLFDSNDGFCDSKMIVSELEVYSRWRARIDEAKNR